MEREGFAVTYDVRNDIAFLNEACLSLNRSIGKLIQVIGKHEERIAKLEDQNRSLGEQIRRTRAMASPNRRLGG